MRGSSISACGRGSFGGTASSWSRRTGRTASWPRSRSKYTFGVDPLQQYLIEFPDGRLQALSIAWDSRPKDKGGQRWFHLYPNEQHRARRHAALDQAEPELELHVRRVPFDRRAQELRCAGRSLRHDVGRDQRRLRSLPRPGLASRRLGAGPAELVAVRKADDDTMGLLVRFDERSNVTWPLDPNTGNATRSAAPATLRKEVETCGLMPRPPRPVLRELGAGPMAVGNPRRLAAQPRALSCRRADARRGLQLRLVQAEQDVCGRRHLQRLPRSAQRQAAARRTTISACNVMRRTSSPARRTTATRRWIRRSAARPATCRSAPTWSSIGGMITASASRVPICPCSSDTPNACNDCHADQDAAMGGRGNRKLARPKPQRLSDLRAGVGRELGRPRRCIPIAGCGGRRSRHARHRPRHAF